MDAVKFLKEKERMCNNYSSCDCCPIAIKWGCPCTRVINENYGELVNLVENWSKDNPEKLGNKYIIEIDKISVNGFSHRIKGTDCWINREELEQLKEYKESEE